MTTSIRSEILKVTSLNTIRWLVIAQVVLFTLAASGTVASGALSAAELATESGQRQLLAHGGVGAILSLCLGITLSAGEYRHGTVLDTFLSEPRRERVTAAKVIVATLVGLVVGAVVALTTVMVSLAWCEVRDVSLNWSVAGRCALGILLWQTLFTVLGTGFGAMVRNQVTAVLTAVAWLYIAETALGQLISSVGRWLPTGAASALAHAPADWLLPQVGGGLVLAGWTAAVVVGGLVLTSRRDPA
jgi:ABC-2 type transport system permease protein